MGSERACVDGDHRNADVCKKIYGAVVDNVDPPVAAGSQAEGTVNQLANARMNKRRQMRW
jgi:hypothetical protein